MKKKVIFTVAVFAIALTATLGVSQMTQQEATNLTDLALNNTEALAFETLCPNGCLTTKGSCNCRGTHPYEEANWDKDKDKEILPD